MFNKTVLDNGIHVLTEEINEFKSASIGIWINSGPKNETEENSGVSHFVEHMLFKGTERHSARDIAEIMDSVGGQLNAFTEKEQTCYYTRVVDEHVPLAMDILTDMFLHSQFDPQELERERGVILEEIKMYEDSPEDVIFELFNKTLWEDHPLGTPTLGRQETVENFTREDFLQYMERYYTPDNVFVAAAGHLKHDDIVRMTQEYLGGMKGRSKAQNNSIPRFVKRNHVKYRDCEQVYVCLGGKGINQRDDKKFTFFVLDSVLGGSMSSRLFQEIREKRGLVYTLSTYTNSYCHTAQFGIYLCTSKENLPEVLTITNSILDDLAANGITEKEMIRAKEHIKGGVSLALESTSNRMIRLSKSQLYHKRLVPIEEVIEKVNNVTMEGVRDVASWLLDRKGFTTAVLGPVEDDTEILSILEA
jgi:predicted Zn-dependent peptidase